MIGELELDVPAEKTRTGCSLRDACQAIFGLRPGRAIWGAEPLDLGACFHRAQSRRSEALDRDESLAPRGRAWSRSHREEHEMHRMSWYSVPEALHEWGQPQFELHPSWGDLFLDLIYVGCAYQLGSVMSTAFYDCTSGSSSSSSLSSADGGHGSASADEEGHRRLASTAAEPQECIGMWHGAFFALALFQCLQRLWLTETAHFRASFSAVDKLHVTLDMLGYFLLIVSAANIGPVQTFLHPQPGGDISIAGFLVPLWAAHALWALRFLEVALCARDEGARRWGATRLVDDAGLLLGWWGAAVLLDILADGDDAYAREAAVGLMLVGAHWAELRLFWRVVVVRKCLHGKCARIGGGARAASGALAAINEGDEGDDDGGAGGGEGGGGGGSSVGAGGGARSGAGSGGGGGRAVSLPEPSRAADRIDGRALATERTRPPANVEFLIHRFDEFMYLMLGETVLGIILAPREEGRHLPHHFVTELAGFFIVSAMLFSYQVLEPRHAHRHAFRRAYVAGLLYVSFYTFKTVSVLFVGISIKLAIYDPSAPADAHFARSQRLLLGLSLATCFGLELLMRPLHVGLRKYYSLRTLRKNGKRTFVIGTRLGLVGAMAAASAAPLRPVAYLWLQTALTLMACVLAHFQHHTFAQADIDEYRERKLQRAVGLGKGSQQQSSYGIGAVG